eukprot:TRINITY_DN6822_c0_g1_i17.p2 TRINITY_DN6822_c0_g1~~TRINITY_DN6822_c0_g1_i17.p2  ORF type:complete len:228 (+),score=-14.99 TRINITY_DN6822_c0_g1_i17:940-1623(+)
MIFSQLICEPYFFIRPYYHYNIQNISSTQDIVTQQQTKDQTYYNSNIYYVPQTPRNIRIKYYAFHLINTPNFHQLTLAKIPKEKEKQKTLPTFKSLNAQKFTGKKRRNNKNQQNQPKVYKYKSSQQLQIVLKQIAKYFQRQQYHFTFTRMQIPLIFQKKKHRMKDSLQFLITSKIKSNEKLDTQSTSNFSNRQNDSLQFLITSKIKSNEKLDTQPTSNFSNKSINPS